MRANLFFLAICLTVLIFLQDRSSYCEGNLQAGSFPLFLQANFGGIQSNATKAGQTKYHFAGLSCK